MRLFQIFDRLVTSRIAVGLVLFALLALLVWYAGPKVAIDGSEPLASQTSRLIAIAVLGVVFLALEAFRRWRLNRLNRRILSNLEGLEGPAGPAGGVGRVRESYALLCEALRTRAECACATGATSTSNPGTWCWGSRDRVDSGRSPIPAWTSCSTRRASCALPGAYRAGGVSAAGG